jgi:hemerythrin
MFFVWDKSYDTGIDVIDTQHRKIVDYINRLNDAIDSKDKEEIERVFENLFDYCVSHFSFEESLMQEHGYQHLEGHRRVHNSFTESIKRYKNEWNEGRDISRKLLSDLKIWLISHIQKEDQFYAEEIRNKLNRTWISKMLGKFFPGK